MTTSPPESDYCDQKFDLYSISDEKLENRVKLNWPRVTLTDRPDYDSADSGFLVITSVNENLCLTCPFNENIVLWTPFGK